MVWPVKGRGMTLATLIVGLMLTTATSGLQPAPAAPALSDVTATAETPAVSGDNADDPAIWVNKRDPGRSLVIGALKNAGLGVYDLKGALLQQVDPVPTPPGATAPSRFNNVDLVHGFRLAGHRVDLAVVTDRGLDQVRAYRIDAGSATPLVDVSAAVLPLVFSADLAEAGQQATAYGLATWTDARSGRTLAYVTQRHSLPVAELELFDDHGKVSYRKRGQLDLPGRFRLPGGGSWSPCEEPGEQAQSEAMVVDAAARYLYIAQEDVGIWRVPVPYGSARPTLVDRVRSYGVPATYDESSEECVSGSDPGFGGKYLTADVEGLQVVAQRHGPTLLIASSQGDNTFAAYDRNGTRYRGGFAVVDGPQVDGSSDCDGVAIAPVNLGPAWPGGLAVIQDGDDAPDGGSNFKFVSWSRIADGLRR
jgi:3-phytase